jgi:AraC-like DNA-binding protein
MGGRRLERSCTASSSDYIRFAPGQPGLERIEARFAGHAYDPHRHDTYAIGYTLSGVQTFDYRGAARDSLPGDTIVIHPDEIHDGRAGSQAGFCYRMVYVEPSLVMAAFGESARALPFSGNAVQRDERLIAVLRMVLDDLDAEMDDLLTSCFLAGLADVLAARDPSTARRQPRGQAKEVIRRVADFLDECGGSPIRSTDLEAIAGLDRFTLARQFRAILGTSPYRYLIMRRLDTARRLIREGATLADAAADAGFADQSHMTRQFKQAYGLSPGLWRRLLGPCQ